MPQTRGPYKTKTKSENPVVPAASVSVAAAPDEECDLSVLACRIQQLEDALLLLQSSTSEEQHPLLADNLLQIKNLWTRRRFKGFHQTEMNELTDYVGTLSIGAHGDAKYLGSFGGTEGLLHVGAQELQSTPTGHSNDPNAVILPAKPTIEDFIQNLPPKSIGWELCEIYLQNGSIRERFVRRNQLMQEIFEPAYAIYTGQATSSRGSRILTTHKIATLFLVFAIGSRLDITLPFDNLQADRYFQLGRSALSLGNMSVMSSAELCTVQALLLVALYHLYSGRWYDLDTSWTVASLAVKCAESLGLHLESTIWNLDETILNRRRAVWWEAFSFDLIHSSHLGRPPTVRPSYMNCKLPDDPAAPTDRNGLVELSIDNWRWTISKDVFASLVEQVSGTECPPYSVILEADRKLQNIPVPSAYQVDMTALSDEEKNLPVHLYLRKHLCTEKYFIASLHIHRHSFIRAVLEYASNPLGSPYGPSFLASYKAAASIISLFVKHMNRCPDVLMRCWAFWGTLLSVTMVVGSIVVRCPSSPLAPKAYVELGLALTIFERGAEQFTRGKSGLVIVRRLMGRASEIFHSLDRSTSKDQLREELEIFGGQTKVLFNGLASPEQGGIPPLISSPVANWLELYSSSEITADPTTSFPDEFLTSLMDDSSTATQSQWQMQTGPTPEWHAFIQQAGLI